MLKRLVFLKLVRWEREWSWWRRTRMIAMRWLCALTMWRRRWTAWWRIWRGSFEMTMKTMIFQSVQSARWRWLHRNRSTSVQKVISSVQIVNQSAKADARRAETAVDMLDDAGSSRTWSRRNWRRNNSAFTIAYSLIMIFLSLLKVKDLILFTSFLDIYNPGQSPSSDLHHHFLVCS